VSAAPAPLIGSPPKTPPARAPRKHPRPDAAKGVRTYSNHPLGLGPIRVVSYGFFAVAAVLAGVAAVQAAAELVAGAGDKALAALQTLVPSAVLAGIGVFVRHRAYIDVWRFEPDRGLVTHVRRRLYGESVVTTHPFSSVVAVQVTETHSDDFSFSVDLVLGSGQTVFISNDRTHADELASLLAVPKRGP
jgi:hypothetical protein